MYLQSLRESGRDRVSLAGLVTRTAKNTVVLYLTRIVIAAQAGKSSAISSSQFVNWFLSFPLSSAKAPSERLLSLLRLLNFTTDKSASARKHRKAGVCLYEKNFPHF